MSETCVIQRGDFKLIEKIVSRAPHRSRVDLYYKNKKIISDLTMEDIYNLRYVSDCMDNGGI